MVKTKKKWRLYLNKSQIERARTAKNSGKYLSCKICPVFQCLSDNKIPVTSVWGTGEILYNGEQKYKVCELGIDRIIRCFDRGLDVVPQHFMVYEI